MSSTSVSLLSAGAQQLYNQQLLPGNLPASVLNSSSSGQLGQLATDAVALQQVDSLLGISSSSDTATLSQTATDSLTQAVSNALTSNLNTAVQKFLPQESNTGEPQINLLA